MRPPCEIIVRYILPAFRALIAKELLEKHALTQATAAKKLGTTQATIERMPAIRSIASETAKNIVDEKLSSTDAMSKFCKLCMTLRTQDVVCKIHKDLIPLPETCRGCLDVLETT